MNKLIAEALVGCGYAESTGYDPNYKGDARTTIVTKGYKRVHHVDPFADTLEGRRQADALEDWLHNKHYNLIQQCKVDELLRKDNPNNDFIGQYNGRQKRLDRIKRCFEELQSDD